MISLMRESKSNSFTFVPLVYVFMWLKVVFLQKALHEGGW